MWLRVSEGDVEFQFCDGEERGLIPGTKKRIREVNVMEEKTLSTEDILKIKDYLDDAPVPMENREPLFWDSEKGQWVYYRNLSELGRAEIRRELNG